MSGGQSTASGTTASGETARTDVTETMGATGVPDVSSVTGARQIELPRTVMPRSWRFSRRTTRGRDRRAGA